LALSCVWSAERTRGLHPQMIALLCARVPADSARARTCDTYLPTDLPQVWRDPLGFMGSGALEVRVLSPPTHYVRVCWETWRRRHRDDSQTGANVPEI